MTGIRHNRSRPIANRDPGARLSATRVKLGEFEYEIGPLGHLAAERQRLESLDVAVVRRHAARGHHRRRGHRGAPGRCPSRPRPSPSCVKPCSTTRCCASRQPVTAATRRVRERFGDLEVHPFIRPTASSPSRCASPSRRRGVDTENGWHSDVSWRAVPSMAAVLHAVAVPPTGGDTLFADMYAAYDGLADDLKARIDGLVAVHDHVSSFGTRCRRSSGQRSGPSSRPGRAPGRAHAPGDGAQADLREPVLHEPRRGPRAGRESPRSSKSSVAGRHHRVPVPDPLDADTVVMSDEPRCQSLPRCSDYWPSVRVMERASIVGDAPRYVSAERSRSCSAGRQGVEVGLGAWARWPLSTITSSTRSPKRSATGTAGGFVRRRARTPSPTAGRARPLTLAVDQRRIEACRRASGTPAANRASRTSLTLQRMVRSAMYDSTVPSECATNTRASSSTKGSMPARIFARRSGSVAMIVTMSTVGRRRHRWRPGRASHGVATHLVQRLGDPARDCSNCSSLAVPGARRSRSPP